MNQPLQARAGRNSPTQSLAPDFTQGKGFNRVIQAAAAPGVDFKLAEGGRSLLSPQGMRAYIGANPGGATLQITATVRDPNGDVIDTDVLNLLGTFAEQNFNIGSFLPEGYSLWVNVTLTAGSYSGDAMISYGLVKFINPPFDPVNLTPNIDPVVTAPAGHVLLIGTLFAAIYNKDSIAHDYEVYVVDEDGTEMIVDAQSIPAGAYQNFLGGVPLMLSGGQKVSARLLVPIATPGATVTVMGIVYETNEYP